MGDYHGPRAFGVSIAEKKHFQAKIFPFIWGGGQEGGPFVNFDLAICSSDAWLPVGCARGRGFSSKLRNRHPSSPERASKQERVGSNRSPAGCQSERWVNKRHPLARTRWSSRCGCCLHVCMPFVAKDAPEQILTSSLKGFDEGDTHADLKHPSSMLCS